MKVALANDPLIYLDYNATTQVATEVIDAMQPYWRGIYGNPSSSHRQGRLAHDAVERARFGLAGRCEANAAGQTPSHHQRDRASRDPGTGQSVAARRLDHVAGAGR